MPPNACASAAPPIMDQERLKHMVAAEMAAISLDAKRRRLHALVGPVLGFCLIVPEERGCSGKAS